CCAGNNLGGAFNTIDADGAMILANVTYVSPAKLPYTIKSFSSRARFATLSNGLSNTLLVGEKHVPRGKFGQESNGDGSIYNGDPANENAARIAGPNNLIAKSPSEAFNIQFGSSHSGGGCNFLFGDGGVRSISPSIDGTTLGRLSSRTNTLP